MQTLFKLSFLFLITGCAPTRFVEPLKKEQLAVGGNIGGPIINYGGAPVPIPMSAIEVGYGIKDNLTVHGGIHTTAMLFGNAQMDAGITYKFLDQKKYIPNLSVSPSFNFVVDPGDRKAKFWPILDLNAYWNYGEKKHYFYVGFNNYFELSPRMANDQPQKYPLIFSPQIGHILKGKNRSWELSAELKFIAPYMKNTSAFLPFDSVTGNYGGTGLYIGFRKMFNFKKNSKE